MSSKPPIGIASHQKPSHNTSGLLGAATGKSFASHDAKPIYLANRSNIIQSK
jgi:hypothetical protein